MALTTAKQVPFWPDGIVAQFPHTIALLGSASNQYFRSTLTHKKPQADNPTQLVSETSIRNLLRNATRGSLYALPVTTDNRQKFALLIADLKVVFSAGLNSGDNKRLFPQQVYYADSADRARAMRQGVILQFRGVEICSGGEFRQLEEANPAIKSGLYVDELAELLNIDFQARAGMLRAKAKTSVEETHQITDLQKERLDILKSFIDSEYDIDCLAEQNEPGFSFTESKASSVRHIKRQFYDFTLETKDYERLVEKQIKLVATDDTQTDGDGSLTFEVADYEPVPNQPIIRLSTATQVQSRHIPKAGTFKLMALPVLKNIRAKVLAQLESGSTKNPWLLPLLSKEYEHPPFQSVPMTIKSDGFPPTKSQQEAIEGGVATPDYALVLGPPGTGKTTVILEWVKYYAKQGKRVLITSQNNKAVDNVLERLVGEPDFECLRIGNESKVSASLADALLDNKVRELQKRMFTKSPELDSYLSRVQDYLNLVQQRASEIAETFKAIERHSKKLDDLNNLRQKAREQIKKATDDIAHKHDKVSELQNQSVMLHNSQSTGLFKIFKRGLTFIKLWRLNAQIATLIKAAQQDELLLSEQTVKDDELTTEINDTGIELTSQREMLAAIEKKHPGNYTDTLEIPSLRALYTSRIHDLRDAVESVKKVLNEWFNKVSSEREQSLYPLLLEHVNVVGATCIGINTKELFRNIDFDVVIVDEAGQIQVHNLMVPLSRCEKAILVGDHKQIRPIVQDEVISELKYSLADDELELYNQSWFEILWNSAPEDRRFMLDTQFRCPSEISDFVSAAFYEGKYYAGTNKLNSKPLLSFFKTPFVWLDTSKMDSPEQRSNGQFSGNRTETNIVVEVFKRAIEEQPELLGDREVAIIVPYKSHIAQIKKRIKALQQSGDLPAFEIPISELVASVDSFQGQERDLIIFACSRSNRHGNVGFMKAWQRMNVAVTRAKRQLVMIGNTDTMTMLNDENAPDATFKIAMQQLVAQLKQSKSILPGFWFLPKSKKKKPVDGKEQGREI